MSNNLIYGNFNTKQYNMFNKAIKREQEHIKDIVLDASNLREGEEFTSQLLNERLEEVGTGMFNTKLTYLAGGIIIGGLTVFAGYKLVKKLRSKKG